MAEVCVFMRGVCSGEACCSGFINNQLLRTKYEFTQLEFVSIYRDVVIKIIFIIS